MFGTAKKGAIRAYDTTVTRSIHGSQDSYRVIVDAATGKLLYRQNLVDNLAGRPGVVSASRSRRRSTR